MIELQFTTMTLEPRSSPAVYITECNLCVERNVGAFETKHEAWIIQHAGWHLRRIHEGQP